MAVPIAEEAAGNGQKESQYARPRETQYADDLRQFPTNGTAGLTEAFPLAAIPQESIDLEPHISSADPILETFKFPAQPVLDTAVFTQEPAEIYRPPHENAVQRPQQHARSSSSSRNMSTPPPTSRHKSNSQSSANHAASRRHSYNPVPRPPPLNLENSVPIPTPEHSGHIPQEKTLPPPTDQRYPSPMPPAIPLPPMSIPTLLQLELAGQRPSPFYIHHSYANDIPYESNAVKFERLKNFLLLPTFLERTINFGAFACLDAWLWTLTILPMRFCIALGVLSRWWMYLVGKEARWLIAFVWEGLGRMWERGKDRRASVSVVPPPRPTDEGTEKSNANRGRLPERRDTATTTRHEVPPPQAPEKATPVPSQARRAHYANGDTKMAPSGQTSGKAMRSRLGHRRTKSVPSNLTSFHKADLLQGAVIVFSAVALMNLDASRMYHFIRAQSAVKLYVIYNLVEVGDRLLSALGQDVFECLFSSETLSRNASGRSKIMLPFGMFLLALVYNIVHSVVLFYQVITLNVAVNSYSNALLSLLMSNQFVEVKSSVFKRTEKENTFQLACADIVERFQLWIVLFIIALRNIVEIGGLSVPGIGLGGGGNDLSGGADEYLSPSSANAPVHSASILPASFTILPSWLASGEVLSPFLIVIGSEMIVDWIKHAYINKFNNIKPKFYSRVLDILCKDYYTNAFVAPALMRRLGLPLIPLCTLFIRTSVQTYHMFLATHIPSPLPPSMTSSSATPSSPAMVASLERLDAVIRNALGRAVYGKPYSVGDTIASSSMSWWSSDSIIAGVTMLVVFFLTFLILLIAKLLLGMALLRYSRNRYAVMKLKEAAVANGTAEPESFETTGKRTGAYSKVEVGEERRRWLFKDDPEGLRKQKERMRRDTGKGKKEMDLNTITRYEMIAKRIW